MAELSLFSTSILVWLDETGLDQQNTILAYGYSFIRHQLQVGGNSKQINATIIVYGLPFLTVYSKYVAVLSFIFLKPALNVVNSCLAAPLNPDEKLISNK